MLKSQIHREKNYQRANDWQRRQFIKRMVLSGVMTCLPVACRRSDRISPSNSAQKQGFHWQQFAGTEISLLLNEHPWTQGIKPYLSDFEALTGINIKAKIVGEPEYFQVMESAIQTNSMPVDAFFLPMDSTAYRFWRNSRLRSLTPLMNNPRLTMPDYNLYDFPEGFRLAAMYPPENANKELFGIPATFEAYILFYNKVLVNQYLDGAVPKTMADLVESAIKLKQRGQGKFFGAVMRGIASDTIIDTVTGIVLNHWGSQPSPLPYNVWFDGDWQNPRLQDQRIVKGLTTYAQLMQTGPPNIKKIDWSEATRLFRAGKVGFYIDASLFGPDYENQTISEVAGNVGYAVLPPSEEKSMTGHWLWGLGIPQQSKNFQAAWLFIQWASSQTMEPKIAVTTGGAPRFSSWLTPSVYTEAMNIDYALAVQTAMRTSRPTVVLHPSWNQVALGIATTIQRIYDGTDADVAVAELQTQVQQIMGQVPGET